MSLEAPIGVNPKDPLIKTTDDAAKEMLRQFGLIANQFPKEAVLRAAINFLGNVIRQNCKRRKEAEAMWDEHTGFMKQVLLSHYDSVTGKRRESTFPTTQRIIVPYLHEMDSIMPKKKP